jgi:general stress protein YciG
MSGNREGGLRAAEKIKARNPSFYVEIGRKGGAASTGYAFAHGKLDPSETGKKGGRKTHARRSD